MASPHRVFRIEHSKTPVDRLCSYMNAFCFASSAEGDTLVVEPEKSGEPGKCDRPEKSGEPEFQSVPGYECVCEGEPEFLQHGPILVSDPKMPTLQLMTVYPWTSLEEVYALDRPTVLHLPGVKPPTFAGQHMALRALVASPVSGPSILDHDCLVVALRVDPRVFRVIPKDSMVVPRGSRILYELSARMQTFFNVPITRYCGPVGVPHHEGLSAISNSVLALRRHVFATPFRHTRLRISASFAKAALPLLRTHAGSARPPSVEQILKGVYESFACLMPHQGDDPYPENRAPEAVEYLKNVGTLVTYPKVSILTITHNRPRIFFLAANNFLRVDYPNLEWVIVDDSDDDQRPSLSRFIGDSRVKYARITRAPGSPPVSIGAKRQMSCQLATGDVFVHMDDDDYLVPGSVPFRVAALESGFDCVGSTHTLCYDVGDRSTFYCCCYNRFGDAVYFPEPSMAYTRRFWEQRAWSNVRYDEGRAFLAGRLGSMLDVPSTRNVIMLSHGTNFTEDARRRASVPHPTSVPRNDAADLFHPDFARLANGIFRSERLS